MIECDVSFLHTSETAISSYDTKVPILGEWQKTPHAIRHRPPRRTSFNSGILGYDPRGSKTPSACITKSGHNGTIGSLHRLKHPYTSGYARALLTCGVVCLRSWKVISCRLLPNHVTTSEPTTSSLPLFPLLPTVYNHLLSTLPPASLSHQTQVQ